MLNIPYQLTVSPSALWMFANMALWRARESVGEQFHSPKNEQTALIGPQRHLLATTVPPLWDVVVDMNQRFSYPLSYDTFSFPPDEMDLSVTLVNGYPLPEWITIKTPSFQLEPLSIFPYYGSITDIEVDGNYAYFSSYTDGMLIMDIRNKRMPVQLNTFDAAPGNRIQNIAYKTGYVYVPAREVGLHVIDVRDSLRPSVADSANDALALGAVAVDGNYAIVSGYYDGMSVYDISQPSNIRKVGSLFRQGGYQDYPNILYDSDYAFFLGKRLEVVDVSTPSNPRLMQTLTDLPYYYDAAFRNSILYAGTSAGLVLYNLSDATQITPLANYSFHAEPVVDVFLQGERGFFITPQMLWVANITQQNALQFDYSVDIEDCAVNQLVVQWDYAYVACGQAGAQIFDLGMHWQLTGVPPLEAAGAWELEFIATHNTLNVSQEVTLLHMTVQSVPITNHPIPTQILQPGQFLNLPFSHDAFYHVKQNDLWLTAVQMSDGQHLPDWLSLTTTPRLEALFKTEDGWIFDKQEDYIFFADHTGAALQIIQLQDTPKLLSTYLIPNGQIFGIASEDNYVYLGAMLDNLQVIDISNRTHPRLVRTVATSTWSFSLARYKDYLLAANDNHLQIFSLSDPSNPSSVGSITIAERAMHVSIFEHYAFTSGSSSKNFYVIDIEDVSNPRLITTISTPSETYRVTFFDHYALLADVYYGFQIADISDIENPEIVASVQTASGCFMVEVVGNYVFALNDGLIRKTSVYDISNVYQPKLLTTTDIISGRYSLAEQGKLFLADTVAGYSPAESIGLRIVNVGIDTWSLTGMPTLADHGIYDLELTVEDDAGKSASTTFSIIVNYSPEVTSDINDIRVNVGQALSYAIAEGTFKDNDQQDILAYTASLADGSMLPPWITFNPNIRKFTGIPAVGDAGEFPITVHVADDFFGVANASFVLTVNTPPAFIADLSETNILVQVEETFSRSLSNWFYDADGHALTYQVTSSDGSPLDWMTYTPANVTLWGKPNQHNSGVHHLQIVADDDNGGEITAYAVVRVNSKPILNYVIGSYTAYVGEPFNLQLPYTTFIDVDEGDVLTYVASEVHNETAQLPLSGWLSFDDNAQKFTGIPTPDDKGRMRVKLGVFDGNGGEAFVELPIEIPNRSPEIQTVILPPSAQIWQRYEYSINPAVAIDLDGDSLKPTVTMHNGEPLSESDWLHFDADNWLLFGRPGVIPWQGEDVNLRFQVSDGENTAETKFVVPVGIDYMIALIGSVYALTGGFFLASNLIAKSMRAYQLSRAAGKCTQAAQHRLARQEIDLATLQALYGQVNQTLNTRADNVWDAIVQYTTAMKRYFLNATPSDAGNFDRLHLWHAIRDSIAEIKQRVVTSTEGTHSGYQRYLSNDVDWCAGLAWLTQTTLLIQNHIGRKASYDERKHCQKELETIVDAIEGDSEYAIAIQFHLACAQEALVCMADSHHWLSLRFLVHLAAVTLSPPNGALSLNTALKDIPAGWYPRLVMVQQLAQMATHDDNDGVFRQVLALRNASNDWRFVYGYTLAMQEIVAHCRNEQITSQARTQLQALQGFSQFRVQRFNGCCFFRRCCQNRNYWIRRQAERNIEAPAQIEADAGAAIEMMVAPNVPPPAPPPGNGM